MTVFNIFVDSLIIYTKSTEQSKHKQTFPRLSHYSTFFDGQVRSWRSDDQKINLYTHSLYKFIFDNFTSNF